MATQTEIQISTGEAVTAGTAARQWMTPEGAYLNEAGTAVVVQPLLFITT